MVQIVSSAMSRRNIRLKVANYSFYVVPLVKLQLLGFYWSSVVHCDVKCRLMDC